MLSINVHGSKEALLDFITNKVAICNAPLLQKA